MPRVEEEDREVRIAAILRDLKQWLGVDLCPESSRELEAMYRRAELENA